MCKPTYFDVSYEINPWMNVKRRPESGNVEEQWNALYGLMKQFAPKLCLIDPQVGLPDMVFSANGALVRGKRAVVASFRYPERQMEALHYQKWLEDHGYVVSKLREGYFEGEGDALMAGDHLIAGWGFRSGPEVFEKVAAILDVDHLTVCEMVDPRFYHLDTCFAPLNATEAIFYPGAFTALAVQDLEKVITLIEVDEDEACRFACNQVVVGEHILIPSGCPKIGKRLEDRGFQVHPVQLDEFLKAGGAAKCMVLKV